MPTLQDGAQTRMIHLIVDLFEAHKPIPFAKYQDEEIWGNERTFRRMKAKLNEIWELRRGTPLFEIVDASGNPSHRGERFLKLQDRLLKVGRIEQMSVMPAFMQLLSLVKGTILEDTFEPRYREFREGLSRNERQIFDRTERKFFFLGKGAKSYADKSDILDVVYDALIREHLIDADYVTKAGNHIREKIIPLTLVMFNNGLFLLCRFYSEIGEADAKTYTFALDNFKEVIALTREHFDYPLDFSPAKKFEGSFGLIHGDDEEFEEVVLEYKSDSWVDQYLRQRKWTGNETYSVKDNENTYFKMRVKDLREVNAWLIGIATQVKVVSPLKLRTMLLNDVQAIMERNDA